MKIEILLGKHTREVFSYLDNNFHNRADIHIITPEELPSPDTDILILEQRLPRLCERLVSTDAPPLILILQKGESQGNIRYLPDFYTQFPKLFSQIQPKEPALLLCMGNEKYRYLKKEIVMLVKDGGLTLYLCSGKTIVTRASFQAVYQQLASSEFVKIGGHTAIHLRYISHWEAGSLLMQNGKRIPLTPQDARMVENAIFKANFLRSQSVKKI